MSHNEYIKKSEMIKSSAAPLEVRAKALEELEMKYNGVNKRDENILKDIYAGGAEIKADEF